MRITVMLIICGVVLSIGPPAVQAEEMRGESLGRKGGSELESTQRRALLQMGLAWLMAAGAAQGQEDNQAPPSPPPRNTPDERGQGATQEPKRNFLPPSYEGPTIKSISGALAVRNWLTTGYPKDGLSCAIPATSASRQRYNAKRPYTHSFPGGLEYTLLFISSHAAEYTGYHWAVYDDAQSFYSSDDGDSTSGDYDYEDGHNVPAGCQYLVSSLQQPVLASANVSGNISAVVAASGNAVVAETVPLETAAPGTHITDTEFSNNVSAPAPTRPPSNNTADKLLCKPVTARSDPRRINDDDVVWIFLGVMAAFIIILACCVQGCTIKPSPNEVQEVKESTIASDKENPHESPLDMVD